RLCGGHRRARMGGDLFHRERRGGGGAAVRVAEGRVVCGPRGGGLLRRPPLRHGAGGERFLPCGVERVRYALVAGGRGDGDPRRGHSPGVRARAGRGPLGPTAPVRPLTEVSGRTARSDASPACTSDIPPPPRGISRLCPAARTRRLWQGSCPSRCSPWPPRATSTSSQTET